MSSAKATAYKYFEIFGKKNVLKMQRSSFISQVYAKPYESNAKSYEFFSKI